MVAILILEIVAGGLAAIYRVKAEEQTRTLLKSSINSYYATPDKADAVTLMWNHLMAQMSCCGVDDYRDFDQSSKWANNRNKTIVPAACCVLDDRTTFKPKDPYCPNNPTGSNSFKDKVYKLPIFFLALMIRL